MSTRSKKEGRNVRREEEEEEEEWAADNKGLLTIVFIRLAML